jgi:hypothetical protein
MLSDKASVRATLLGPEADFQFVKHLHILAFVLQNLAREHARRASRQGLHSLGRKIRVKTGITGMNFSG